MGKQTTPGNLEVFESVGLVHRRRSFALFRKFLPAVLALLLPFTRCVQAPFSPDTTLDVFDSVGPYAVAQSGPSQPLLRFCNFFTR